MESGGPELLGERPGEGEVAFAFLGFSGVVARVGDVVAAIDVDNLVPPELYGRLERVDLLLFTHRHPDHFHLEAAMRIYYDHTPVIVAEPSVCDELSAYIPSSALVRAPPRAAIRVRDVVIGSLEGRHVCPIRLFLLRVGGVRLFHGGDSGYVDLSRLSANIAFVPTGSPSPTASPEDALKMVRDLRPRVAVPVHGSDEDVSRFLELARGVGGLEVLAPQRHAAYRLRVL